MSEDPLIGQTFYFTPAKPVEDAPRGGNGSQVLPVAQLDQDFDGIPQDGSEYLFLVRREAASHAKVYRAALNPYAVLDEAEEDEQRRRVERSHSSQPSEEWRRAFVEKFQATRSRMAAPPSSDVVPRIDPDTIPPPRQESAWRIFINGKRSKAVKPSPPTVPVSTTTPMTTNEDVEMDDLQAAKIAILAALELDAPDDADSITSPLPATTPHRSTPKPAAPVVEPQLPEYERLPQLPTPSLVLSIPKPSLIHVLTHFSEWYQDRLIAYEEELNWVPSTIFAPPAIRRKPAGSAPRSTTTATPSLTGGVTAKTKKEQAIPPLPTPHEIHWILSLLTRLDELLDGDDLSNLRLLSKTLVEMIEASELAEGKEDGVKKRSAGRSMEERRRDEEDVGEARARSWMVVAAIAGIWKQEDLWDMNL